MSRNSLIGAIIVVAVLIGGYYWYTQSNPSASLTAQSGAMGSYAYICDNGSQFTMAPAEDMSEITLEAGSQGMFTGTARLAKMGDAAHYETTEGTLIVLSGAGEEVQLAVGEATTSCNPVPNSEMAPWNWGDAAEGGSVKQDVTLIVGESIVGKWQSTQDPKSVREFKDDGTVVDIYDGKVVSTNLFVVFTKANAPKLVAFPLDENAVYIELTEKGTQQDTLDFKVAKLTPDELQLVYMQRGGTLTYKSIQ